MNAAENGRFEDLGQPDKGNVAAEIETAREAVELRHRFILARIEFHVPKATGPRLQQPELTVMKAR